MHWKSLLITAGVVLATIAIIERLPAIRKIVYGA